MSGLGLRGVLLGSVRSAATATLGGGGAPRRDCAGDVVHKERLAADIGELDRSRRVHGQDLGPHKHERGRQLREPRGNDGGGGRRLGVVGRGSACALLLLLLLLLQERH